MKKALIMILVLVLLVIGAGIFLFNNPPEDIYTARYAESCATCHGEMLEGTPSLGPPLINSELRYGDTVADLVQSIGEGYPERGMPAWSETLSPSAIKGLAIYVAERRVDRRFTDFKTEAPLILPEGPVISELETFRVEEITNQLHYLPYSLAPLPDGSILVTEKTQGLRVISADGSLSELVSGTPEAHDDEFNILGVAYGLGWLLDVKPHPDYENNGWIYLSFTDRCPECDNVFPTSMAKLVRGRIKDGAWVDEETIWAADRSFYTSTPDTAVGGRIAFDGKGHVYMSHGVKGASNYHGIQDLSTPYGKIHRMHEDGRVPADNPFVNTPGAYPTIFSYGHRSPQGLEYNYDSDELWSTEMGPRGGDELNLILPGRNYGWPLYSKGLDYDGTPVQYGEDLDIEFQLEDIEQPIVDWTPSPAIASFIIYQGDSFPAWQGQYIVGSLKGTELYRVVVEDYQYQHSETLLKDIARVRDVETGFDGNIYLLLEHADGSRVVRLVQP